MLGNDVQLRNVLSLTVWMDECSANIKSVFITGQGGVGKSMVLKLIIQHFEEKDRESIGVVAPTGIAATAFPNGETIHRLFSGVGIPSIKSDFGNTWQKMLENCLLYWFHYYRCH